MSGEGVSRAFKRGSKVYWHGLAPNPDMVGVVGDSGTMNTEVTWLDGGKASLQGNGFLKSLADRHTCSCAWCSNWRESQSGPAPQCTYEIELYRVARHVADFKRCTRRTRHPSGRCWQHQSGR